MADVATITALLNLVILNIRDKTPGVVGTKPIEVRQTLEAIIGALAIDEEDQQALLDLTSAMVPDNHSNSIDPNELRAVLNAIISAIGLNSGSSTGSIPIRRPYVIKDQNGNLPDILPNVPYLAYVRDYGTTINEIISEVSEEYIVGIVNYVGTIINDESDNYDEPRGQGVLWFELYLRSEPPISGNILVTSNGDFLITSTGDNIIINSN